MERHGRAVASFLVDAALVPGTRVALDADASHHVRVKRLNEGDVVRLTDGKGAVADGVIASIGKRAVEVAVESVETIGPPSPIHVRVPIADRERMLWLAEKATELGVATWQAVRFRRSASVSPRGEGPAFDEKVRARMIGALEQSGGAWLPRILPSVDVGTIRVEADQLPILLDAKGVSLAGVLASSGDRQPVLLFGPEGGLDADERSALADAGWQLARIAATTLRFETAGIAAIAVCRTTNFVTED